MGSLLRQAPHDLTKMTKFKLIPMIICLVACGSVYHAVSVSITPYPRTAQVQQSFSFSVQLDSVTQMRGFSISIAYDPTKISYSRVTRGAIFNGMQLNWWRVNPDTLGVLHVEGIVFGAGTYVTGPGILMNASFTALAGDYTPLEISFLEVYDVVGYAIPAIESIDGGVIIGNQPAYLSAKCYLQGPYSDGWMSTRINPYIPLSSPYATGMVVASAIPVDVVDWVLIELRSAPFGSPVASQAAFLHEDGSITSVEKPFILFMNTAPGPYHVVIRHRNHLAIMSANPVTVKASGLPEMVDMSDVGNIYDRAGIVEYDDGNLCAMLAGDADMDGGVFPSDRNNQWRPQNGQSGYRNADFNLNGIVSNSDLMLYWRVNAGASSIVP